MPPICFHLSIAKDAAEQLYNPTIDQNMASYLIGATSPDVHIITGVSREGTHFFDLEDECCESGVKLIFKAHPNLAKGGKLDATTKSFVAGYLSHLVTDEIWLRDIYRPFFGNSSLLSGDLMANMLDRLLQFELDRREREDRRKMEEIQTQIDDWEPNVNIGFLSNLDLRQWRDFICTATDREPTLAFFPLYARRFLIPRKKIDPEQLKRFLSAMPASLEWAIQYVTPGRLTAFKEKAISQSAAVAGEYLGEDN
ncbi:MAG: zinc dependent phospholipase C family protein [Dehalococcoidia bacterium]|nr:zinc dependent phospholipase C family protein [Dehalococcoidia bacterium]